MTGRKKAMCYAAIDLSKSRWVVAVYTAEAREMKVHRLEGFDAAALINLLNATRSADSERAVECERILAASRPATTASGFNDFWKRKVSRRSWSTQVASS